MSAFDMDELKDILRKMGGVDEADLDGDIADTEFAFLGYDSLALLELCSQVERRYGVQISDEAVLDMPTPAKAVDYVNSLLTAKAGA
ncbi:MULTISPECIES: acyl carrier protein [Nonomuraea]|jgi:act minimal PKS acyl carrier protein|uniref:Acyl carrier protein n=1 Tax=Nonomuraea salmonea TaxID=46181 RepID=A0ABV5NCG8_9ACTN